MKHTRPSTIAIVFLISLSFLVAATLLHSVLSANRGLDRRAALATQLGLTDLALFTEARYTRHPSQADLHSPFQDHPTSLDHFPTGSFLPAPRRGWAKMQSTHP